MCGFSGIISQQPISIESAANSIRAIKHRGMDDSLLFEADEQQFFAVPALSNNLTSKQFASYPEETTRQVFGFNRLSIVDLSANAMQPFYDKASQTICMLNGEIYNYKKLREQYLQHLPMQSGSDAEVAFRLYLQEGNEFIHLLQGMFSIVIYDIKNAILKVWRDRVGMKPFYYYHQNGKFIFSSEMKGIFATGLAERHVDYTGLAYSMYLGTCPAPLTIHKDIKALPAAHYLEYAYHKDAITITPYWQLTYHPGRLNDNELEQDINDTAALHTTGDVKKMMMLSGGMDSGLLAHAIAQHDSTISAINTFAIDHSTDEREMAALNARNAGMPLLFEEMKKQLDVASIEQYVLTEEEPNHEAESAYFVCERARQHGAKVLYCALGPDEIFGGYGYYRKAKRLDRYRHLLFAIPSFLFPGKYRHKHQLLKKYGIRALPFVSREKITWQEIAAFLQKMEQPVPEHPIGFLMQQAESLYSGFAKLPLLKQISWLDIHYYIGSHHSFRSDQPAMFHSIEMRFPFLDHLFIEKYFNDSHTFDGIDQYLKPKINALAQTLLPQEVVQMPKKGFGMPTKEWAALLSPNPTGNYCRDWYFLGLNKILKSGI